MSGLAIFAIILILIVIIMLAVFFLKNIEDTKWWRDQQAKEIYADKLAIEMELAAKYSDRTTEAEKNDFIKNIKNGESVKIPYSAFDYIYRNIDQFGYIDQNGQIVLVHTDEYEKLIQISEKKSIFEPKQKLVKNGDANYQEVRKNDKGEFVKRNLNTNEFKFVSQSSVITKTAGISVAAVEPQKDETNTKGQDNNKKAIEGKYESSNKIAPTNTNKQNKNKVNKNAVKANSKKVIADLNKEFLEDLYDLAPSKDDDKKEVILETEIPLKNEPEIPLKNEPKIPLKNAQNSTELFETNYQLNYLDFDTLLEQNLETTFFDILMVILDKMHNLKYPVIFKNNNLVYINISYLALCFANSISDKKNRENFIANFFNGAKTNSINRENILRLIEKINNNFLMQVGDNLIQIWKNKNEENTFFSSRTFEFENKKYSGLMLSMKIDSLERINVDTFVIEDRECLENVNSGFDISKDIFDRFLKF